MTQSTFADNEDIGTAAGVVWGFLNNNGATSLTALTKGTDLPKELALQAIGWLAREDKVDFEKTLRGRLIVLKGTQQVCEAA
ncbi:MAG: winged helix-turn-helix domain-containing protein [Fuerstiella sp.]